MKMFLPSCCFSCIVVFVLKAISESLWQPKIHSIWLVHKASAKGPGWSLMEIWELAKILSVSWEIAYFSVLQIAEISG